MVPHLRGLESRARLLAAGLTDRELRRLRRTRAVATVRPGAYVPWSDDRLREAGRRHALLVRATVPRLGAGAVVSHVSAAVLHGLPVWGLGLDRVQVTRDRISGARRGGVTDVHAAALGADESVLVDGIAVTTVARTVVDIARSVPFAQAVAVADAALHAGLTDPATLAAAVARGARRPGSPAARRAVRFADARAESPGESRSRVAIADLGLPGPVLQQEMWSAEGGLLGRVDFWWPAQRTVGEFDGRTKYGRLLAPGQDAAEVLWAEKLREDALRAQGLRVVRWVWRDLDDFGATAARLRRAFAVA